MKFAKWTNPKNGQTRIYVNGASSKAKVYIVDGGDTGHYSAGFPEIVVYSEMMMGQSEKDSIIDAVDAEVQKLVPSDVAPTFADYLSLVA